MMIENIDRAGSKQVTPEVSLLYATLRARGMTPAEIVASPHLAALRQLVVDDAPVLNATLPSLNDVTAGEKRVAAKVRRTARIENDTLIVDLYRHLSPGELHEHPGGNNVTVRLSIDDLGELVVGEDMIRAHVQRILKATQENGPSFEELPGMLSSLHILSSQLYDLTVLDRAYVSG